MVVSQPDGLLTENAHAHASLDTRVRIAELLLRASSVHIQSLVATVLTSRELSQSRTAAASAPPTFLALTVKPSPEQLLPLVVPTHLVVHFPVRSFLTLLCASWGVRESSMGS